MSLLAPWFLLGLAALFVPIVLHRFSHSEPDEYSFPSTRFLDATRPPVSRKRKLRYRTLFSLRSLFLLLLCLAGDRWSKAISQASELLESLPGSDQVQLLGFSHTVSRYTTENVPAQDAIALMNSMQAGQSTADYGQVMQQIDRLARESSLPVNVAVITDTQRNSLPSQLNALFAPGIASLKVIDVSENDTVNYSIRALAQVINSVFVELDLTVSASISGSSSRGVPRGVPRAPQAGLARLAVLLLFRIKVRNWNAGLSTWSPVKAFHLKLPTFRCLNDYLVA